MRRLTDAERDAAAKLYPVALAIARTSWFARKYPAHLVESAAGMAACDIAAYPDHPRRIENPERHIYCLVWFRLVGDIFPSWFSGRRSKILKLRTPEGLSECPTAPDWMRPDYAGDDDPAPALDALRQLTARQQAIITLTILLDVPFSTAARMLGIKSIASAHGLRRRGLARLRTLLSEAT